VGAVDDALDVRGHVVGVADVLDIRIAQSDHALETPGPIIVLVLGGPAVPVVDPRLLTELVGVAPSVIHLSKS
jgi:hypothetical protein